MGRRLGVTPSPAAERTRSPGGYGLAGRGALPPVLTALVGRRQEEAAVGALLRRPDVRLVTLTGPPGVGKTRLAVAIASKPPAAVAGAVRFVGLAPIPEPGLVLPAIGRVFGVPDAPAATLAERLIAAIGGRRLLLVLDNFEHVAAAAPAVAGLLAGCPGLTVLATSRAPLRLPGEHEYPVAPLALPAGSGALPPRELARGAAVALFLQRARAAKPDFAFDDESAPAVVGICRRLDGLPLAIELAAAQVKLLSPPALLARLEHRLPLPAAASPSAPARHRSVRDAVAWSYDLLSPVERALFRRLAVFVGGCTLEAAEAVAPSEAGGPSVLEGVGSLVDQSLVWMEEQEDAPPRYRMLETMREYGLDRLEGSGEAEVTRGRHADFFVAWLESMEPALFPETERWMRRVEPEHANVRAALAWLARTGQGELALRLAGAVWPLWWFRGYFVEGREQLQSVLASSAPAPSPSWAKATTGLGFLLHTLGDHEGGVALQEDALAVWRRLGIPQGVGVALWLLGYTLLHVDPDRAEPVIRECLAVNRDLGDGWGIGGAIYGLGTVARYRGDLDRATALLDESVGLGRRIGYDQGTAASLDGLGKIALARGDHRLAAERFGEALAIAHAIRNDLGMATGLEGVAALAAATGRPAAAVRLLGAAALLRQTVGADVHPVDRGWYDHLVADMRRTLDESAFATAWEAGRRIPLEQAIAEAGGLATETSDIAPALQSPPVVSDATVGEAPSAREREVLRLIVDGRSDREIAAALSISPRTVANHVASLRRKLGGVSRAALAADAVRRGLG